MKKAPVRRGGARGHFGLHGTLLPTWTRPPDRLHKLVVVLQLFKRHGKSGLIASSDWPKYVEKIRPIYDGRKKSSRCSITPSAMRQSF